MPARQDEAEGRRELDTAKKKKKKEGLRLDGLLEVHLYRASSLLKAGQGPSITRAVRPPASAAAAYFNLKDSIRGVEHEIK
jgi:hypothetical protein